MTRKRNKPTESWVSKTKNELEHSQEIAIKQAYEVGKIRGKKELIDKACEWFQYNAWSFGNTAQGDSNYDWEMAFKCFRKAMEE